MAETNISYSANPLGTSEESGLILRSQGGCTESFDTLICLHSTRLMRHALFLSRDSHMAEDLVQQTFLQAWKSISRFDGRAKFSTWLSAILAHVHAKAIRRNRPGLWSKLFGTSAEENEREMDTMLVEGSAGPFESMMAAEREQILQNCMKRLPDKQREIIYLRFYCGESLTEIARAIGCSEGTVKSRLFYALEKLGNMKEMAIFCEKDTHETV